jgi:hypothetical protein
MIKKHLIFTFILIFSIFIAQAKFISQQTALIIAKNFYYEKSNIQQKNINFSEILTDNSVKQSYYIFNLQNNSGFVIVSADDFYYPIIGYSLSGKFILENQPSQVSGWMKHYSDQINMLKTENKTITKEAALVWEKYLCNFNDFKRTPKSTNTVEPLTNNILWNQDAGWNAYCPADAAGPGGHVYAGCVATAMSIILKYWSAPILGNGSHTYTSDYGDLTADFENTTYLWTFMPEETYSMHSALLMYHCGVAVDMMYSPAGSGAYSFNVPAAFTNYFKCKTTADYISKSSYNATTWANMIKTELNASRPVYYSGRNDANEGHAFVCDGYDESGFFHINYGWSGSNNGFYNIESSESFDFSYSQSAVVGIEPINANYPASPDNFDASLDMSTPNKVNLSWDALNDPNLTGYMLYKDDQVIEYNLPVAQTSYTFNFIPDGKYYFGVSAIYSDAVSLCAADFLDVKSTFTIKIHVLNSNGQPFWPPASVTFEGITKNTDFGGMAQFNDIPFKANAPYHVVRNELSADGTLNVNEDQTVDVYLGGSIIEDNIKKNIYIYPNPCKLAFTVKNLVPTKKTEIFLFDISGKLILEKQLQSSEEIITIHDIDSGLYLLKIISDKDVTVKQLIIN